MHVNWSAIAFGSVLALRAACAADAPAPPSPSPATPPPTPVPVSAETASYHFGVNFGDQMRRAGLNQEIVVDAVTRGLKDGLGGKKITAVEQQQLAQYVRSVRDSAGIRNKAAAKEFLAANSAQKGVKTTASGLQYKVLTAGNGKLPSPQPDAQVTVQYRGKLLDGTEFDSSYAHGQPAVMQSSRVIKGWQEALALMKPGAKWQIFVPPELAYDLNSPPGIPPGSLLIFDIELVSVQAAQAPPTPAAPPTPPAPAKPN